MQVQALFSCNPVAVHPGCTVLQLSFVGWQHQAALPGVRWSILAYGSQMSGQNLQHCEARPHEPNLPVQIAGPLSTTMIRPSQGTRQPRLTPRRHRCLGTRPSLLSSPRAHLWCRRPCGPSLARAICAPPAAHERACRACAQPHRADSCAARRQQPVPHAPPAV